MGDTTPTDTTDWVRAMAQRHLPDVVTRAALCKPNAPGRSMWSSADAFGQRQILKAAGHYLAERVILATTPLEICALPLNGRGDARPARRWDRTHATVTLVPPRGASARSERLAVLIRDARCNTSVELMPVDEDDTAVDLITCLTAVSAAQNRRRAA